MRDWKSVCLNNKGVGELGLIVRIEVEGEFIIGRINKKLN